MDFHELGYIYKPNSVAVFLQLSLIMGKCNCALSLITCHRELHLQLWQFLHLNGNVWESQIVPL